MARIDAQAAFPGLKFGILALGDRSYANYCAFGHALEGWLRRHHALPLFDTIEVDNGEEGALRHWQHQLGVLSGQADMPDWIAPAYGRWRLVERRLLNPGSVGGPVFHLGLAPLEYPQPRWQAGDIAEVGPRDPVDVSKHLPHREYSIASLPEHGTLDLVVRRVSHPDGRLGIGSGWLTQYTEIGDEIALRVRGNSNFHQPEDDRPLILIGNGTGLAGLRAHMQARIAAGRDRNWLVFGERSRAVDYLYRDEIEGWLESGRLQRLDLAFSRDQTQRIYVQDRLRESAAELRIWVEQGAAIYVCGSLLGMADGVAAALNDVLGENRLITLAEEGRYRRDVY